MPATIRASPATPAIVEDPLTSNEKRRMVVKGATHLLGRGEVEKAAASHHWS